MVGKHAPLETRFWQKVSKTSGCWEWTANTNNKGYGLIRVGGTAPKRLAHRISYELANGPIPDGLVVCHRCDNPRCVNPAHLFLGTMRDNTHDMMAKGRHRFTVTSGDDHPQRRDPTKVLRGERNGNAKLDEAKVRVLRARLAAGEALRAIARETGLDRKTLMAMRDRKSWAHIQD